MGAHLPALSQDQRHLIQRFAGILPPGGRLLFTSSAEPAVWNDAMTELETRSLGVEEYRRLLREAGFAIAGEDKDEGRHHYFDAIRTGATVQPRSGKTNTPG